MSERTLDLDAVVQDPATLLRRLVLAEALSRRDELGPLARRPSLRAWRPESYGPPPEAKSAVTAPLDSGHREPGAVG